MKSQKQAKENRKYVKSLIQLGYKEKQLGGVIFGSKLTLNHLSNKKKKKKKKKSVSVIFVHYSKTKKNDNNRKLYSLRFLI